MTGNRDERLAADCRDMLRIQDRPYLSWIATKGELPAAEEYLLDIRLRTYALSTAQGGYIVGTTRRSIVSVTLWDSYPHTAPYVRMLSQPPVFHPRWYSKGTYCPAEPWHAETPLIDFIKKMIGTLIYDPDLTDTDAPANYKALDWYRRNREKTALFPSDSTPLTENSEDELHALENAALFDEIIDSWHGGRA